jgi:hypothetical protein
MTAMDIGAALDDPAVFQPWFHGDSWNGWKSVLRGAFCEKMTKGERTFFNGVANRAPPAERVKELWVIAGRRSGKDSIASVIAAHIAVSFEPAGRLRRGERATVMCLACDREQAKIVLNYVRSYFTEIPPLKAMVVRETADGFELNNGVDIVVATNDYRAIRGRTVLACIFDEVAYWPGEHSTSPDKETYRAIRPGMATLPGSMLIGITTAYRRQGLAYDRWQKHFGRDGAKVLVIRAETRQLNPSLPQSEIDDAMAEDPQAARADYFSEWRDDLQNYIGRDLIMSAVDVGVTVRPHDPRHRYFSFIDASSGQRDSFSCAVTHREGDVAILDCLVEVKAPFSTASAVAQIVKVLKSFKLTSTMGDDHAKGWVIAELGRHNFGFDPRPTEMDRSALYLETLPLFSAGRVRLLDSERLVSQYAALERRVMPGGRDRVDHPNRSGHHDDLANACAGSLWRCTAELPAADWSMVLDHIGRFGFGAARGADAREGEGPPAHAFMGERAQAQARRRRAVGRARRFRF